MSKYGRKSRQKLQKVIKQAKKFTLHNLRGLAKSQLWSKNTQNRCKNTIQYHRIYTTQVLIHVHSPLLHLILV